MKKIEGKIFVNGRKWFERTNGNTYHSVTVYVNNETLQNDFCYGYGDHYKQTAMELLKKNGYEVPEKYGDFIGLENVIFDVTEVSRKKDL